MWFLKGRPTNITVNALLQSLPKGYQATNYRFKIDAEESTTVDGKVWIGIAFPWAPHKEDGSFVDTEDTLSKVSPPSDPVTVLHKSDVELHIRPRALKKSTDVELIHVQELCHWYLEDTGIATCWVKTGQWYQINFRHKIASDSCLFLPSRLPTVIQTHSPKLSYELWVLDAWNVDSPKHLVKSQHTVDTFDAQRLQYYTFKEDWLGPTDTHIHTENWESSDDASTSSEE